MPHPTHLLPLTLLLLSSCVDHNNDATLTIDLNRTTQQTLTISPILTPDTSHLTLTPSPTGVYTLHTSLTPTGIYLAQFDPQHAIPLAIHHNQPQQLCGTYPHLDSLTASNPETQALIAALRLQHALAQPSDSLRSTLTPTQLADTLTTLRTLARPHADALLNSLPPTSLAAIPILNIPGLYNDISDHQLLLQHYSSLATTYPHITPITRRATQLAQLSRLLSLRSQYAQGNPIPHFSFTTPTSTLTPASLLGRRFTIALIPDSASSAQPLHILNFLLADGQRVLIQSPDNLPIPQRSSLTRGHFDSLTLLPDLLHFAPALISVAPDGTISSLRLGHNARPQH